VTFSVRIYFKKGRRWANFPSLAVNTPILVTARVSGFSRQGRCLALLVNDVDFLPGTPRLGLNSEHNLRQDRWTHRAVQPSITSQKIDFEGLLLRRTSCPYPEKMMLFPTHSLRSLLSQDHALYAFEQLVLIASHASDIHLDDAHKNRDIHISC
jgi:hypothetical protein